MDQGRNYNYISDPSLPTLFTERLPEVIRQEEGNGNAVELVNVFFDPNGDPQSNQPRYVAVLKVTAP